MTKTDRYVLWFFGSVVAVPLLGLLCLGIALAPPAPSPIASPVATQVIVPKPAYCADKSASYRLVECGWTTEKQQREEAVEDAAKLSAAETAYFKVQEQLKKCEQPIEQLTLDDVETCNLPFWRAARGAQ